MVAVPGAPHRESQTRVAGPDEVLNPSLLSDHGPGEGRQAAGLLQWRVAILSSPPALIAQASFESTVSEQTRQSSLDISRLTSFLRLVPASMGKETQQVSKHGRSSGLHGCEAPQALLSLSHCQGPSQASPSSCEYMSPLGRTPLSSAVFGHGWSSPLSGNSVRTEIMTESPAPQHWAQHEMERQKIGCSDRYIVLWVLGDPQNLTLASYVRLCFKNTLGC